MIKDIALDPGLFCQWEHHLALRREFSVEKGRLIAQFPGKWQKVARNLTYDLEKCGLLAPVKAATVRDWLSSPAWQSEIRFSPTAASIRYDGNKIWHLNAEESAHAFDAILSDREVDAPNAIIADDDRDYLDSPLFLAESQITVPRTRSALVDCVWPLAKMSGQLRIVEPNFNPNIPRFLSTLEEFLDRLHSNNSLRPAGEPQILEVEIHVRNPTERPRNERAPFTVDELRAKISPLLRTGYTAKVFMWTSGSERLHPRYLLTDRGGIQIDWGWDESQGTTSATRLPAHQWREQWGRYCIGSGVFAIDPRNDVITIT